jgi:hypothetical protein
MDKNRHASFAPAGGFSFFRGRRPRNYTGGEKITSPSHYSRRHILYLKNAMKTLRNANAVHNPMH